MQPNGGTFLRYGLSLSLSHSPTLSLSCVMQAAKREAFDRYWYLTGWLEAGPYQRGLCTMHAACVLRCNIKIEAQVRKPPSRGDPKKQEQGNPSIQNVTQNIRTD